MEARDYNENTLSSRFYFNEYEKMCVKDKVK